MLELEIKQLMKVPIEKWKHLAKECYDVTILNDSFREQDFTVGFDAENEFLEIDCWCEKLNQTQLIVGEDAYRKYILEEGGFGLNIKFKKSKIEVSLKVVTDALKSDPAYRESWKANIAMAYIDNERWYRERVKKAPNALNGQDKHNIAIAAAEYFLKQLCDEIKVPEGR